MFLMTVFMGMILIILAMYLLTIDTSERKWMIKYTIVVVLIFILLYSTYHLMN